MATTSFFLLLSLAAVAAAFAAPNGNNNNNNNNNNSGSRRHHHAVEDLDKPAQSAAKKNEVWTDQWVVEVPDGAEVADAVAKTHGFHNVRHVSVFGNSVGSV